MKNVMVLGHKSFVSSHLSYPKIADRLEPDAKQIRRMLNMYKPDVLINCISYCGSPNIDACDLNKEKTITSNVVIPTILANECEKLGIRLIHLGSGCIFYRTSSNVKYENSIQMDAGWKENDFAAPESF